MGSASDWSSCVSAGEPTGRSEPQQCVAQPGSTCGTALTATTRTMERRMEVRISVCWEKEVVVDEDGNFVEDRAIKI